MVEDIPSAAAVENDATLEDPVILQNAIGHRAGILIHRADVGTFSHRSDDIIGTRRVLGPQFEVRAAQVFPRQPHRDGFAGVSGCVDQAGWCGSGGLAQDDRQEEREKAWDHAVFQS